MIGMFGATIPRCEQVPRAIAAGCDMYLFFNDREEDFGYMMDGYKNGIITEERLNDALHRILGVKAALNLHTLQKEQRLMQPKENLSVVGCEDHHKAAAEMADRLVAGGVKGIWNFTNTELRVSDTIMVENVHFADSLLTLNYMISEEP